MAVVDRIKYDGSPDELVWKYPKDNITMGAQLIVNESQEAVFFKGGQALDVFGPGTYTLSTKNLPILQRLVNLPFGSDTPFAAEIFFVNKVARLDYKWGTKTPIPIEDPKYKVLISVGCFGQFGLRINDSRVFVTQIVGTVPSWGGNRVLEYFQGIILTRLKDSVAKFAVQKSVSIAAITAQIDDISQKVEERLRDEFAKYGLELLKFYISSITIPDEELKQIREIDLKAREIERLGDQRYQMARGLDIMEKAANNPGAPGTLMATGIGLGLGAQMAGPFAQMTQKAIQPATQPASTPSFELVCPQCKAKLSVGASFCSQCGAKLPVALSCPYCGATLASDSKFCSQCGKKVSSAAIMCPSCGAKVPEGAKFCSQCGKDLL
ncbi:MAG TPA: SPFH domain-containing protein [Candidatus Saccharicenans sp.]|jgi:membrane protease subunit (stomatin/prohibitin family)|nr:SPFH domain-containing protein [Candidatus Saccharicenans sp.]HRD02277.1 SPFH domain-containing protein [Candidatus Saccharicenans sp.]